MLRFGDSNWGGDTLRARQEEELLSLLEELRSFDISFLNLNELEITVGNHENMELRIQPLH